MSARIVAYKDYVAGWFDSTIHDIVELLSTTDSSTKYALITCLDSNPQPASLRTRSPELKSIAKHLQVRGSGLLLPTELMVQTEARQPIFFGFDEVWFFPNADFEPRPDSTTLVGPARLNQARLRRLGKWMIDNECSLGLGGGEGVNFVVKAHGLAKFPSGMLIGAVRANVGNRVIRGLRRARQPDLSMVTAWRAM